MNKSGQNRVHFMHEVSFFLVKYRQPSPRLLRSFFSLLDSFLKNKFYFTFLLLSTAWQTECLILCSPKKYWQRKKERKSVQEIFKTRMHAAFARMSGSVCTVHDHKCSMLLASSEKSHLYNSRQITTDRCIETLRGTQPTEQHRKQRHWHALRNIISYMLLWYECQIDTKCNLIFVVFVFLDAFSKAKEESETKDGRTNPADEWRGTGKIVNWLTFELRLSVRDRCLSFYEWDRCLKKRLRCNDDELKLNEMHAFITTSPYLNWIWAG